MISKLSIVEEEADETAYWLDLLVESRKIPASRVEELSQEVYEIVSMTVSSIKTLRSRSIQNPKSKI